MAKLPKGGILLSAIMMLTGCEKQKRPDACPAFAVSLALSGFV
jgi:hypothetical protein